MKTTVLRTTLAGMLWAAAACCADDGPVVGIVEWEPALRRDATLYDKTDYWAAIAFSPSTGKYGSTCEWTSRVNAERVARENCNAADARVVVLCCNGWCALALGKPAATGKSGWGVGWGPDREKAERFALEGAREQVSWAKVAYSINAREMRTSGVIAYSSATGKWAYSFGYGRGDAARALQGCEAPDAKIVAGPKSACWMALALGDDKGVYGWGHAGNRADAERNALEECRQRTKNAKVAVSFCTNGVTH